MEGSDSDRYNFYVDKINQLEFIELKRKREESSRWRKFRQSRVMFKHDWAQFKNNAYYGGLSGGVLGLVLSVPIFIKYRQISTVIASVILTGGFFAAIGGVGTFLRHEDLELAEGRLECSNFVVSDF